MNYNGRLRRLEDAAGDGDQGEPVPWRDFAVEVLEAVADGLIVDWCDKAQNADFDYTSLLSPTVGDGLDEDEHSRVYALLHHAQDIAREIAMQTGWRSGGREDWQGYRANGVADLRFLMGMIYDAT